MSATIDVTISIVNFNTRDVLRSCLESLMATRGVTIRIYVVDNASSDGTVEMVRDTFPHVQMIANSQNQGFAAANNRVIRQADGRYVLLLNPDTEVPVDVLSAMVSFMDRRPDVGICGPAILSSDGSVQSCGESFPTLSREVLQSRRLRRLFKRFTRPAPPPVRPAAPFEVDWVGGACLMARRKLVEEIGVLDEQFFLYAEELDWCYRARKAGWKICVLPAIAIVHHRGKSTEQVSEAALAYLTETRLRYYRKNHGLWYAALVSLVYLAGALNQWRSDRTTASVRLNATGVWWRTLWSEPRRF